MYMLLLLSLVPAVSALECYSCGVFLSAPTSKCKGEPSPMNCTNARSPIGCVYINGKNMDGTYYVEKRCGTVEERDLKDGDCIDVTVQQSVKATKCFCTSDLCNGSYKPTMALWLVFAVLVLSLNQLI